MRIFTIKYHTTLIYTRSTICHQPILYMLNKTSYVKSLFPTAITVLVLARGLAIITEITNITKIIKTDDDAYLVDEIYQRKKYLLLEHAYNVISIFLFQ